MLAARTTAHAFQDECFRLHDKAQRWLHAMFAAEGADPETGFRLHGILRATGLDVEYVRAGAIVQTPDAPHPLAEIVRAVLSRLVGHGTAAEAEIDTPAGRIRTRPISPI